jgi:Xaa-Pro dipeptidase
LLTERLTRLRGLTAEAGYDAIVAMSPDNATYVTGFTVPSQKWSRLRLVMAVIPAAGLTRQIVVNVEESFCRSVTALDEVVAYNEFTQDPVDLLADSLRELVGSRAQVGLELDYIPQAAFQRLISLLPELRVKDASQFLRGVRAVKAHDELAALRFIGRAAQAAIHEAVGHTRAGDTELNLAGRIAVGMLKGGADSVNELVVASGQRSSHANAFPTTNRLEPGDTVRLNGFGYKDNYPSDVTRTAIVGKPHQGQIDLWKKMIELRQHVFEMIRPGMSTREVYESYCKRVETLGYEPIDFVGHGLGLQVHEPPYIGRYGDADLQPGMVFAIEPIVTLPGGEWGFQIEDEIVVTEAGFELLTDVYPEDELMEVGLQ